MSTSQLTMDSTQDISEFYTPVRTELSQNLNKTNMQKQELPESDEMLSQQPEPE